MTITNEKLVEISAQVRDHLIKQGRPAIDGYKACVYLAADGAMCAVGCLIKPEHYSTSMEGLPVSENTVSSALFKSLGIEESEPLVNLLGEWQQYHDEEFEDFIAKVPVESTFNEVVRSPMEAHDEFVAKLV